MSNYDLDPSPSMVLTSAEQIKAYVNPTRMTILALLAQEKQSVSSVARHLNVHPANLTHHFKLLQKVGLIQLVEKRETRKKLEKLYRAVAYRFTLPSNAEIGDQHLVGLSILRDNLDTAINELQDQAEAQRVLAILKTIRIRPEALEAFQQKLLNLAEEFVAYQSKDGQAYSLNASLYPTQVGHLPAQQVILRTDQ